jgi:hypothetical protein
MNKTISPMLAAPRWACRSVVEDGGVTHERVSSIHPMAGFWPSDGVILVHPTDVSVSVVDHPAAGSWVRLAPSIQVEGGCYSVEGARGLRAAIDEVLAAVGEPVTD